VRCHWANGKTEDVDRAFLDSLQGNDTETLQRANGIKYLEYLLPIDYLKQVTLVDTPGTGAILSEHQGRVEAYMQLQQRLRERHNEETQQLAERSDAIIYVVGQVGRADERQLLEEFAATTQERTRARNAVGVMAKIDLSPEFMARRHELAARIAAQLEEQLNTVVPVSAGIQRVLGTLLHTSDSRVMFQDFVDALRRIPESDLDKMLSSEDLYAIKAEKYLSDDQQHLVRDMPWSTFTTVARIAYQPQHDLAAIEAELRDLAGFEPLKELLDQHFFTRGHLLRCYRILLDARKELRRIEYTYLADLRRREHEEQARLARFLQFIRQSPGDATVAQELSDYLKTAFTARASDIEKAVEETDREIGYIFHELEEHNADFDALQTVDSHRWLFSDTEYAELRGLFGLYDLEPAKRLPPAHSNDRDYARERQRYWQRVCEDARALKKRDVAEQAVARYNGIVDALLS
jgi:hypothetical protein